MRCVIGSLESAIKYVQQLNLYTSTVKQTNLLNTQNISVIPNINSLFLHLWKNSDKISQIKTLIQDGTMKDDPLVHSKYIKTAICEIQKPW